MTKFVLVALGVADVLAAEPGSTCGDLYPFTCCSHIAGATTHSVGIDISNSPRGWRKEYDCQAGCKNVSDTFGADVCCAMYGSNSCVANVGSVAEYNPWSSSTNPTGCEHATQGGNCSSPSPIPQDEKEADAGRCFFETSLAGWPNPSGAMLRLPVNSYDSCQPSPAGSTSVGSIKARSFPSWRTNDDEDCMKHADASGGCPVASNCRVYIEFYNDEHCFGISGSQDCWVSDGEGSGVWGCTGSFETSPEESQLAVV